MLEPVHGKEQRSARRFSSSVSYSPVEEAMMHASGIDLKKRV